MLPSFVKIVEVSPRDGLQNEAKILPTETKVTFINRLAETGLKVIEAGSFVSPKWIPQLADTGDVFAQINKQPDVNYPVLVPNLTGFRRAQAAGAKEIAVFTAASETFSQRNINCSIAESFVRIEAIMQDAKAADIRVRGYLSCIFGCPYEGDVETQTVVSLAERLWQMGCYEVSLGDTLGVGTPLKTRFLLDQIASRIPLHQIAVHFHDTYGQALVNIFVAMERGISVVDSSVAGLGGCPYANGTGNVATEDVIYMLHGMNIKTDVDLVKLIELGRFISQQLDRSPHSKVNHAYAHREGIC